jgi:hypothetical protein
VYTETGYTAYSAHTACESAGNVYTETSNTADTTHTAYSTRAACESSGNILCTETRDTACKSTGNCNV